MIKCFIRKTELEREVTFYWEIRNGVKNKVEF